MHTRLIVYDGIKARDKRAFIMGYFLQVLWLKHIKQESDDGKSFDVGTTDNAIKLYVHLKDRRPTKNYILHLLFLKVALILH